MEWWKSAQYKFFIVTLHSVVDCKHSMQVQVSHFNAIIRTKMIASFWLLRSRRSVSMWLLVSIMAQSSCVFGFLFQDIYIGCVGRIATRDWLWVGGGSQTGFRAGKNSASLALASLWTGFDSLHSTEGQYLLLLQSVLLDTCNRLIGGTRSWLEVRKFFETYLPAKITVK